jgi:NADH:ubiquinone oxidoreductase subunit H
LVADSSPSTAEWFAFFFSPNTTLILVSHTTIVFLGGWHAFWTSFRHRGSYSRCTRLFFFIWIHGTLPRIYHQLMTFGESDDPLVLANILITSIAYSG